MHRENISTRPWVEKKEGQILSAPVFLLRIGAVGAIAGAIISVAAGIGFGNLTNEAGIEEVLDYIAAQPAWYWPSVHLGFIMGAILWVSAFIALTGSFRRDTSRVLGWLGAASVIIGAAIHVVDASISGFGLSALANTWATAPVSEQASLLLAGDTMLWILGGTWWGVISYFHGIPFILYGLAVVLSRDYPAWLGWLGILGGVSSFIAGITMFLDATFLPDALFIIFALVVSLWMVLMGVFMWGHADRIPVSSS